MIVVPNMNEKNLRNTAIITSLVGLIILFFVVSNLKIKEREVSSISTDDINNYIKTCGEISERKISKNGHIFLKLKERDASINAVIFNSTAQKIKNEIDPYLIKKYDNVCVYGKVNLYNGNLEIICNKVEFNKNVP